MLSGSIHDKMHLCDAGFGRRGAGLLVGELEAIRSVMTKPNKRKMLSSYCEQSLPDSVQIGLRSDRLDSQQAIFRIHWQPDRLARPAPSLGGPPRGAAGAVREPCWRWRVADRDSGAQLLFLYRQRGIPAVVGRAPRAEHPEPSTQSGAGRAGTGVGGSHGRDVGI